MRRYRKRRGESSYQHRVLIWLLIGALILVALLCISTASVIH